MVTRRGGAAVVTGAGRGLGRAIVLRLAEEGVDVAVLARSGDDVKQVAVEAEALGVRALGIVADVSSEADVLAAAEQVERDLGDVDIVVNSAGVLLYKPFIPLPGLETNYPGFDGPVSDAEWNVVMDVHLGGTMRVLRVFGPGMVERGYGRVVNVVSNVVRRTVPFTVPYDTAKGAVVQLTRSLAREWARYGVTVNAIAAGHYPTDMSRAQFEDPAALRSMLKRIPAGRAGEPRELADLVAYLCGDSSAFVTGETIAIDGGETL